MQQERYEALNVEQKFEKDKLKMEKYLRERRNKVEKHQDDTDRATCIKLANASKRDDDITEMHFWSTEL